MCTNDRVQEYASLDGYYMFSRIKQHRTCNIACCVMNKDNEGVSPNTHITIINKLIMTIFMDCQFESLSPTPTPRTLIYTRKEWYFSEPENFDLMISGVLNLQSSIIQAHDKNWKFSQILVTISTIVFPLQHDDDLRNLIIIRLVLVISELALNSQSP